MDIKRERQEFEAGVEESGTEAAWYGFITLEVVRYLFDVAGAAQDLVADLRVINQRNLPLRAVKLIEVLKQEPPSFCEKT